MNIAGKIDNSKKFTEQIKQAENIIIFSHVNPDGDTLGSMLGLSRIIKKNFGKQTTNVVIGKIPETYSFMSDIANCTLNSDTDKSFKYDLAIAVDVAAKDRMVDMQEIFFNAKCKVNIDHHVTNNGYADINIIDSKASSTGEVIYGIVKNLGLEIDNETANYLYTAILTDTGGFRFENTSSKVFNYAAELMEYGVNPTDLYRKCYESKPKAMALLNAYAIQTAVFKENDKIAYTIITKEDMKNFNAKGDYTEGISEALRQINSTEVAMLLKESENQTTKVSLRSKKIDVAKIAENFNGGGHHFAAGCTIQKPPQIAVQKLLELIKKELKCINKQ